MSYEKYLELMLVLYANYDKEPNSELLKAHYEILKKYDLDSFKRTIFKLITTAKFLPRLSEIIDILDNRLIDDELESEAIRAYLIADIARNRQGAYKSIAFLNDYITETLGVLYKNWVNFCNELESKRDIERLNFVNTYKALRRKGDFTELTTPYLIGLEMQNALNKYEINIYLIDNQGEAMDKKPLIPFLQNSAHSNKLKFDPLKDNEPNKEPKKLSDIFGDSEFK
ncbi:MAG: hypothetical protein J6M14_07475 [Campylobacter sp.]|nr:hypothetical protein [Campylobacter sp.]